MFFSVPPEIDILVEIQRSRGYWGKLVKSDNWKKKKKKGDNIASYLGVFLVFWTKNIAVRKRSICSILKMQLDTASLKPRICAICKHDIAETASPNDCVYCVLYQTVRFCLGKRLSKRALCSHASTACIQVYMFHL